MASTYRDDAVQASVGWPLVELTLQTGNAPVILTGILRPGASGDRAWCRVVEFAEEFGISVSDDPQLRAIAAASVQRLVSWGGVGGWVHAVGMEPVHPAVAANDRG